MSRLIFGALVFMFLQDQAILLAANPVTPVVVALGQANLVAAGPDKPPCDGYQQAPGERPSGKKLHALRAYIHDIARREGVDPFALEAIARVEGGLKVGGHMIGRHCELGPFQICWWWYERFKLPTPTYLFDWGVSATVAARIYRIGYDAFRARFRAAGRNKRLREAGWKDDELSRAAFAAMTYNWGAAPSVFKKAKTTKALHDAKLAKGACRYAVNFQRELRRARAAGKTW